MGDWYPHPDSLAYLSGGDSTGPVGRKRVGPRVISRGRLECHDRQPLKGERAVPAFGGLPKERPPEERHVPPRRREGSRGLLVAHGEGTRLDRPLVEGPRVEPALRQVVPRRKAQRLRELPGPSFGRTPSEQGRARLGGRTGRTPSPDVPRHVAGGQSLRERPQRPGREAGGPGHDLHAHDPGAPDRDARLRPRRRRAQRDLRGLQRARDPGPGRGRGDPRHRHGGWRLSPRTVLPLKKIVDEAVAGLDVVQHVGVFKRAGVEVSMREGRDHWWHELMAKADAECEPEAMDATDPLFLLYTSGTTGKPKGIQHSTGGYLVGVATTMKHVFDLKDEDLFWCTADIGWVTGHSYIVYGPLANGASVFMYEGAPDWPEPDRFWRMVEEYDITILYTAPTAIRAFMRWGDEWPKKHDLSSLRLLGTVGEPINPEAWRWYHKTIGGDRCPIVDPWWQTETGMILITPLPGVTTTKPGSATHPFPGIAAEV